jgi:FAD-dependent urate hydroxylase
MHRHRVVGLPMGFWREHMPEGCSCAQAPTGTSTRPASTPWRRIWKSRHRPSRCRSLLIGLFLDYAEWFRQAKGIEGRADLVADLAKLGWAARPLARVHLNAVAGVMRP